MAELQKNERQRGVTGAVLKNAAYITMLVDHFFAVLFLGYMRQYPVNGGWDPQLEKVYHMGRAVGRVSFVLFAYLIVEGFRHTRSRGRYLLRLLLFALLSEIPFDLAFSGELVDWSGQNIYWTLTTGVLVLVLWEYLSGNRSVFSWICRIVGLLAGCGAAFFLSMDYRLMGILLIFTLYLTHDKGAGVQVLSVGAVMLFGTWASNQLRYGDSFTPEYLFLFSLREMYGLFAFVLIFFYNGKKGRQMPKPFYYLFYPVHLLLLYGIARLTNVM